MRLENLYPNFGKASPESQLAFIASYRLRRAEDLAKPSTYKRERQTTQTTKIELSEEEKVVMKLLGLKQKDILALRATTNGVVETNDDAAKLFEEDTFEEEE